jgi:hypothetical protein
MGAEKIEKKVGHLKISLQTVTGEARNKADSRIRPAWKAVQKQLERETQTPLRKTELRGRRLLKKIIESTIQQLEKLNRRLEHDLKACGYAA